MDKKELRQYIRQQKKLRTPEELAQQSVRIMQKLAVHPLFVTAQRVMLYASLPDEVQTLDFLRDWYTRKTIILPTVVGDDIVPVMMRPEDVMRVGEYNILEPTGEPYEGTFDLIVVPGMAFDDRGHRLGRGKGYYDRFLAQHPAVPTIGLCFDFQQVEEIPVEPHDKPVGDVLTLS
ncbi:MAG: 5-formyltetrahydrofolate cyclo-ligase [Bacteroidales bacterium]|nr:5-formyltetrahydrofolate cyclo-ligase [Bacteroidales bacterium]